MGRLDFDTCVKHYDFFRGLLIMSLTFVQVMKEVGFEGTLEEFLQHLKDDPQFYMDKKVKHVETGTPNIHVPVKVLMIFSTVVKSPQHW